MNLDKLDAAPTAADLARARNEGFNAGVQWVTDEMVKVLRSLPGGALVLMADVLSRALKEPARSGEAGERSDTPNQFVDLPEVTG